MVWIYCKTSDDPKIVGEYVCNSNFGQKSENKSQVMKENENEDDCWIIQSENPDSETSAMIYRIGSEIVIIELDDNCAANVIELLLKKYGFNKIKWLLTK